MNPLSTLLIHFHQWYTHHEYTVWTLTGGTIGGLTAGIMDFHVLDFSFAVLKVAFFAFVSATISYLTKWALDAITKNKSN